MVDHGNDEELLGHQKKIIILCHDLMSTDLAILRPPFAQVVPPETFTPSSKPGNDRF